MELSAYVPTMGGNLHNLHEARRGIDTHTVHTVTLILLTISIIELIAMTVTLADELLLAISMPHMTVLSQLAFIAS